jgi:hypothetical protein
MYGKKQMALAIGHGGGMHGCKDSRDKKVERDVEAGREQEVLEVERPMVLVATIIRLVRIYTILLIKLASQSKVFHFHVIVMIKPSH